MMPLLLQLPLFVLLFVFGIGALGTAAMPAAAFFLWVLEQTQGWGVWARAWVVGVSAVAGYVIFGFALMAVTILVTRALPRLKPGEYVFISLRGLQWFFTGVLSFLVSKFFLDFLLLTGANVVYFRLMGAKVGKGAQINTKNISDFHLITVGQGAMIGGQATIIGHVGERGKLKLRPVVIGPKATVGLGAVIFPGVEIGERAVVGACSLVTKDEKIPPGSVYVGVPARDIRGKGERAA